MWGATEVHLQAPGGSCHPARLILSLHQATLRVAKRKIDITAFCKPSHCPGCVLRSQTAAGAQNVPPLILLLPSRAPPIHPASPQRPTLACLHLWNLTPSTKLAAPSLPPWLALLPGREWRPEGWRLGSPCRHIHPILGQLGHALMDLRPDLQQDRMG